MRISPFILNLGTRRSCVVSSQRAALPSEKSWCWRSGEDRNPCCCRESKDDLSVNQPVVWSL